MKTLRSYIGGRWVEGSGAPQTLVNPATEEPLAQVSRSSRKSSREPTIDCS